METNLDRINSSLNQEAAVQFAPEIIERVAEKMNLNLGAPVEQQEETTQENILPEVSTQEQGNVLPETPSQPENQSEVEKANARIAELEAQLKENAPSPQKNNNIKIPQLDKSAEEVFGSLIGPEVEKQRLDWQGMLLRKVKYGELEPTDYTNIERSNIGTNVFEAILDKNVSIAQKFVKEEEEKKAASTQEKYKPSKEEIHQLAESLGGRHEYSNLGAYLRTLPESEVKSFTNAINGANSYDTYKFILENMNQRRKTSMGKEATTQLKTKAPVPNTEDTKPLTDKNEIIKIKLSERYRIDPAYRRSVSARIR